MRLKKVYLEISNICNLRCAFCPGTRRQKRRLTEEEFVRLTKKLRPYTQYLYFHLMGEPLCHPQLERFLELAAQQEFRVILTTNGTLLGKMQEMLLASRVLHRVNVSLHAFEANDLAISFAEYLQQAFSFGKAAEGKCIVSYRLWNEGGMEALNSQIVATMHEYFSEPWVRERSGVRIGERVYLEHGEKFDWPELSAPDGGERGFCYALRDQIGVLCDGTVVPCCLDHEGDLALGNLFEQELDAILNTPLARRIYDGFTAHTATQELCRKCGYARRFLKK